MGEIRIDRKTLFALASETRIEILKILDERRRTLTELSDILGLSKTAVKEHLDKLVEAGLVKRGDESRKWIYYELTEKGKRILHPESKTKILLLLSSAIASIFAGVFELAKSLSKHAETLPQKVTKYTITPTPSEVPAPRPALTPEEFQIFSDTHLVAGVILILLGSTLLFFCYRKIRA